MLRGWYDIPRGLLEIKQVELKNDINSEVSEKSKKNGLAYINKDVKKYK